VPLRIRDDFAGVSTLYADASASGNRPRDLFPQPAAIRRVSELLLAAQFLSPFGSCLPPPRCAGMAPVLPLILPRTARFRVTHPVLLSRFYPRGELNHGYTNLLACQEK
jgi:hypothetical protein